MKISQLLILRKNSKFFSKFLISWLKNTKNFNNVELLILANEEDTWNKDFFEYYQDKITVYHENLHYGKEGRAEFYNILAEMATGDFLWHMCDDHYITKNGYDEYLMNYIIEKNIDPNKPNVIMPTVGNSGSISHILSRGYYKAVGSLGRHGNIDSYINHMLEMSFCPQIIHKPTEEILIDFTVDPTIMTPEHSKIDIDTSIVWSSWGSKDVIEMMIEDSKKLNGAL